MILSALHRYYLRLLAEQEEKMPAHRAPMPPWGYMEQGISFVISIKKDGTLHQILDVRQTVKKKPVARRMFVPWYLPAAVRTSGKVAFPLWDKAAYALGAEAKKLTPQHKELFTAHVRTIAAAVKDEGLEALRLFCASFNPAELMQRADWEDISKGFCVFQLEGDSLFVHERPAVKDWWDKHWQEWSHEAAAGEGQCLITGKEGPLAHLHQPTKGVRGAQSSGARIVSFNCNAFESYGLNAGGNAPVGEEAAFAYTTALNYLLRQSNQRCLLVGDASTVFWAERATKAEEYMRSLCDLAPPQEGQATEDAQEEENAEDLQSQEAVGRDDHDTATKVHDILRAARQGEGELEEAIAGLHPEAIFYILGIAPNMARLAVRYWHVCTFADFVRQVGKFVREAHVEKHYANEPDFPPLWQYLLTLAPLGKLDNVPPQAAGGIMRSLLSGQCFPHSLLPLLVARIHADQTISYPRAGLIKAVLMRNHSWEASYMLDEKKTETPYLLGRLFALLEKAQLEANPGINKSIRDKFFSSASGTPASVFPLLLNLNRHHISKAEYGAAMDRKIQEVINTGLSTFPVRQSLEDQGIFILGYYHQRAANYKKTNTQEGDKA